jgi:hypothetical protein
MFSILENFYYENLLGQSCQSEGVLGNGELLQIVHSFDLTALALRKVEKLKQISVSIDHSFLLKSLYCQFIINRLGIIIKP